MVFYIGAGTPYYIHKHMIMHTYIYIHMYEYRIVFCIRACTLYIYVHSTYVRIHVHTYAYMSHGLLYSCKYTMHIGIHTHIHICIHVDWPCIFVQIHKIHIFSISMYVRIYTYMCTCPSSIFAHIQSSLYSHMYIVYMVYKHTAGIYIHMYIIHIHPIYMIYTNELKMYIYIYIQTHQKKIRESGPGHTFWPKNVKIDVAFGHYICYIMSESSESRYYTKTQTQTQSETQIWTHVKTHTPFGHYSCRNTVESSGSMCRTPCICEILCVTSEANVYKDYVYSSLRFRRQIQVKLRGAHVYTFFCEILCIPSGARVCVNMSSTRLSEFVCQIFDKVCASKIHI